MSPAAMELEATIQQQHGSLFSVAYEGVQAVCAERAHAIDVFSVFLNDQESRYLSDIQHCCRGVEALNEPCFDPIHMLLQWDIERESTKVTRDVYSQSLLGVLH